MVSKKLENLLNDPLVQCLLNKNCDVTSISYQVLSWWGYDLFKRRPAPAYTEDGIFQGSDLDLACFLYALCDRNAVIKLPTYKRYTRKKKRYDQSRISSKNRHGQIVGLVSNQHFFSFGIRIIDMNIIDQDGKEGDYRTFTIVDREGNWYGGWKEIEFVPTIRENKFVTENKLWSGSKIAFKNFVHPRRWTSFFGYHYVVSKLLIDRLKHQALFYRKEVKRLLDLGFRFPTKTKRTVHDYQYEDASRKIFLAFECKIYIPEVYLTGVYIPVDNSVAGLCYAADMDKLYRKMVSKIQFMTRATEFAHFKRPDLMPSWIKKTKWENDFVIPKKRKKWERLKLFQVKPGQYAVSILKRTYRRREYIS